MSNESAILAKVCNIHLDHALQNLLLGRQSRVAIRHPKQGEDKEICRNCLITKRHYYISYVIESVEAST